ncbi:3' exoribonuclease family, domain 1 [Trichinella nativa]|uniref:3' exoribonuclease family, domain 1 n=1 Tax=Trichinella nativa TaxID=6335 RepID=A0A1Y3E6X3_9BILA|nr:3' exoribonuclease family, domain 1 [Trichinella nativa]
MKFIPVPPGGKASLEEGFSTNSREDLRENEEFRPVRLCFGRAFGSCVAEFGNTKVFVKTSCSVVTPSLTRPSSGILKINLEFGPQAVANYEVGRLEKCIEYQRLLERNIKDARCVCLDTLCIISGEKVWQIRCDVYVLNNDGSLVDCACVAILSALRHFRIPSVTRHGTDYTIVKPLRLDIFHYPCMITLGYYSGKEIFICEPSLLEETVLDQCFILAMNAHFEFTLIHHLKPQPYKDSLILRAKSIVHSRVKQLVDLINREIEEDIIKRSSSNFTGFGSLIESNIIYSNAMKYCLHEQTVELVNVRDEIENPKRDVDICEDEPVIIRKENSSRMEKVELFTDVVDIDDSLVEELVMEESSTAASVIVVQEIDRSLRSPETKIAHVESVKLGNVMQLLDEIEEKANVLQSNESPK